MQTIEPSRNELKVRAIQRIHAEFTDLLQHEKCRACSCFYADVLNSVFNKIRMFRKTAPDLHLTAIEKDFDGWIKEADFLKMHG